MGEIIFSIVVGGCLVLPGIVMNVVLGREKKKIKAEQEKNHFLEQ